MTKPSHSPTLHLICGLPGSGKTTLAKKLEQDHKAVRMCPDEWIKSIWSADAESEGNNYRDQVEQLQWQISKKILHNGVDVVIEWGTWGRDERDRLRKEAKALGAKVRLYYLEFAKEILIKRIKKRNTSLGSFDFYMPEETLESQIGEMQSQIQIPTADEFELYDDFEVINFFDKMS